MPLWEHGVSSLESLIQTLQVETVYAFLAEKAL